MPVVGGKGRKCLDNMTVFNQENVEEFYEIGDELGRAHLPALSGRAEVALAASLCYFGNRDDWGALCNGIEFLAGDSSSMTCTVMPCTLKDREAFDVTVLQARLWLESQLGLANWENGKSSKQ
ncbi:hypothetical protein D9C73_013254 [Collichthys lucidus]|uniref:Uncharacterized protein n=1 Tax=Collichthys lucidus TaxID=240159 RepID=A0A4U5UTG4_COLLU|nr:hypothetical protein D9C73_013254 [Collichthys lucidus]